MWTWSNIWLIYQRELRDQLRDRRTLLTVVVLPMLLYPLMGAVFMQVAQFRREHPSRIWLIGGEHLPEHPRLVADGKFAPEVCTDDVRRLLEIITTPAPIDTTGETLEQLAKKELQAGKYDAVMYIPADFSEKLADFHATLRERRESNGSDAKTKMPLPQPILFKNTATDRSTIAFVRVDAILDRWRGLIVQENLAETSVPPEAMKPFEVQETEVSEPVSRRAAVWSKILPFVLLVWALTGAFYPAIDLCAGEKERGTLETLLCSPATRTEIVGGKLLTVISFSMASSLLNLIGMGGTGLLIVKQLAQAGGGARMMEFGSPPLLSLLWLVIALPPMAALFSALSLAIAAFARSSKEGQYYLLPLMMVMFPLMTIPMLPAAELNLGTSLIPVTGLMLLLRSLMEGHVWESLRYAVPVIGVTGLGCFFAIRWAVDQFSRESVLFRENEQFGLQLWLKHLMRDRGDTPRFAESLLCAVLLLVIGFYGRGYATMPTDSATFLRQTAITLIAFVATPALLMAVILTRQPLLTLQLKRPSFISTVFAAAVLAVLLHPAAMWFGQWVSWVYPMDDALKEALQPLAKHLLAAPLWQVVLVIGVVPALCEELAFRGFILSGFRHVGNKWTAIVLTAAFFGATHGVVQQSIIAFVMGIVLGYIAVKTGSLLPAIVYHCTHNSLTMVMQRLDAETMRAQPWLQIFLEPQTEGGFEYAPLYAIAAAVGGVALLFWYKSLPYEATREEQLQQLIDKENATFNLTAPTA